MLNWLQRFVQKPQAVFLVHGDADVFPEWSEQIRETLNLDTIVPEMGQSFDLAETVTEEMRVIQLPDSEEQFRHLLLTLDEKYLDLRGRLRQQEDEISPEKLVSLTRELERLNRLIEDKALSR